MKIHFLGTGNASTFNNYNACYLIESNGKYCMFDCGRDALRAITSYGLKPTDIDSIFVSHLHSDHASGIEDMAFGTHWTKHKIRLYAHNKIIRYGWDHCWRAGLESLQDETNSLSTYFDLVALRDNELVTWENITMKLVQTVHIVNDATVVPSYGLFLTCRATGVTCFIPSDSQHAPNQMMNFYNRADYILMDCESGDYKSNVHIHKSDIASMSMDIRHKTICVHYADNWITGGDNRNFSNPANIPMLSDIAKKFASENEIVIALPGESLDMSKIKK